MSARPPMGNPLQKAITNRVGGDRTTKNWVTFRSIDLLYEHGNRPSKKNTTPRGYQTNLEDTVTCNSVTPVTRVYVSNLITFHVR